MMMTANFTLHDIFSSLIAFALFPLVFVAPGYVCAHICDLFDFKKRLLPGRLAIAVTISMAVSPILFFLCCRLGSFSIAYIAVTLLFACALFFFWLDRKTIFSPWGVPGKLPVLAVCILGGWSLFAILSLADIQLGQRLYYSVVSYDLTSRVSITAAISRSGAPPVNPGYFPGRPVPMTFIYYFWYILCSLIDQIGVSRVDARTAMIASVAWCGIGLMAIISLYLRLRNRRGGTKAWKNALLGIGVLSISGLDVLPVLGSMIRSGIFSGRMSFPGGIIEHWNEMISAWLGAIIWVPHHVAGLIACMTAFLLIQSVRKKNIQTQMAAGAIAALSLASASGLTIYVSLVFVLFWALWMLHLLIVQKEYRTVGIMIVAGLVSLLAAGPYLWDLLDGGQQTSVAGNGLTLPMAIVFQVRRFGPIHGFSDPYPEILRNIINLAALPLNYLMELGFFFGVAFLWLRKNIKSAVSGNLFYIAEIYLLVASFVVCSFFRSILTEGNDLGWRGWMFGQLVLLIWAVDIGSDFLFKDGQREYFCPESPIQILKNEKVLVCMMIIGIMTTIFSMFTLRFWPMLLDAGITGTPAGLSPDTQLGRRTYAARLAYDAIRNNLPKNVIVQYDPLNAIDRPSGLYGNHQMVAADHSAYGAPQRDFQVLKAEIAPMFQKSDNDWSRIDQNCRKHSLDVIILNDLDPVWEDLPALSIARRPLYQNTYYAVFACGAFAGLMAHAHKP